MQYLHTMIRISNLEESVYFFTHCLEMVEINRIENKAGRFTLIFLAAKGDVHYAKETRSCLLELTYNWPNENEESEVYHTGRNFGHLAYRVDNIYETCARLQKNNITIHRPPRDGHMAFIKTPNQISIELLQKGDPLTPQEPWLSMPNIGSW